MGKSVDYNNKIFGVLPSKLNQYFEIHFCNAEEPEAASEVPFKWIYTVQYCSSGDMECFKYIQILT